jgi:hypothetical protein
VGLLEEAAPALGEGDLAASGVLDPAHLAAAAAPLLPAGVRRHDLPLVGRRRRRGHHRDLPLEDDEAANREGPAGLNLVAASSWGFYLFLVSVENQMREVAERKEEKGKLGKQARGRQFLLLRKERVGGATNGNTWLATTATNHSHQDLSNYSFKYATGAPWMSNPVPRFV